MLRFLRSILNGHSHITSIRKILYSRFKVLPPNGEVILTRNFSFKLTYTRNGSLCGLVVFPADRIDLLSTPDASIMIEQRNLAVVILLSPHSDLSLFTVIHCSSLLDSICNLLFLDFSKCNTAKQTNNIKCIRRLENQAIFSTNFLIHKITKT